MCPHSTLELKDERTHAIELASGEQDTMNANATTEIILFSYITFSTTSSPPSQYKARLFPIPTHPHYHLTFTPQLSTHLPNPSPHHINRTTIPLAPPRSSVRAKITDFPTPTHAFYWFLFHAYHHEFPVCVTVAFAGRVAYTETE
jgi:hypothetical protein